MKKVILLIICVCLLFFNGISQSSGTYTAKKTDSHIVNKKSLFIPKCEKGFNFRTEVSSTIFFNEFINKFINYGLFLNLGYQLNPYFQIGIGGGGVFLDAYDIEMLKVAFNIPTYTFLRINFLTTLQGITLFFETKLGYIIPIIQGDCYYGYINHLNNIGPFIDLGIGFMKKNFQIKTSLITSTTNLYYSHFQINTGKSIGISLSLAYNIPFKKHK